MASISKKDFAAKCGWTGKDATRKLATYIGRGKVIAAGDWVDDENPINMTFMQSMLVKVKAKEAQAPPPEKSPTPEKKGNRKKKEQPQQIPREETFVDPSIGIDDEDKENYDKNGFLRVDVAVKKKLHYQAEKLSKETKLKEIEIAKKSGELIPAGLLEPIFKNHNQNLMVNFRNVGEDVIREYSKRYRISNEDATQMRELFYNAINRGIEDATAASVSSVEIIVNQFMG